MALSDPIADMLTRVRNAGNAKFDDLDIPGSNIKNELAKILKEEGFIKNYKIIADKKQGILRIFLKYTKNQEHAIVGIKRVSKPSRRQYAKCKDIKQVLNGMGISIISTSKGIMTDSRAKIENMGGEILCHVW